MTIPSMVRAAALMVVIVALFVACGDDGETRAADERVTDVIRQAEDTAATVDALTSTVEDLEAELDDLRSEGEDASAALKALRKKLNGALADLRTSLKDAKGKGDAAQASAASAASRAAEIARELTILEDRFNFHLKSDHKGGG